MFFFMVLFYVLFDALRTFAADDEDD